MVFPGQAGQDGQVRPSSGEGEAIELDGKAVEYRSEDPGAM